jgi:hypothetical protein
VVPLRRHQGHYAAVDVLDFGAAPPPAQLAARAEDDVQACPAPVPLGDVDRLMQPGDRRVTAALPDVGVIEVIDDGGTTVPAVAASP